MEEIPLVYPNHADAPRRYIVRADSKKLDHYGSSESQASSFDANNASSYLQSLDEALLGAASVSSLCLKGEELLVTTSALVETPTIISVALSWKKRAEDALDSPTVIELDVQDLRVVSVRAFAKQGRSINLVLVGCRGTIVTIALDSNLVADTEAPLEVLKREDYIPSPLLTQVGPSNLQGNMIAYLPTKKNVMVMALAPLIVTIDWQETKTSSVWSETQCMDEMSARAAPFTGMITSLPSLVFGKVDADVVDMAPTAALCISTNPVQSTSSSFLVFSLHSDASVRKWTVDPETSLAPLEVAKMDTNKLALPETWSSGTKTVALCARVYETSFALAVYIKTTTIASYDEGLSDCNIWVFEGETTSYVMKVPTDACSLVGMSFSPSDRRCSLSVVFEAVKASKEETGRDAVGSGIKVVRYPPSLLSIVSSEPEEVDLMDLDKVAKTELARIKALPYGSIVLEEFEDDDDIADGPLTIEQALSKVDSLYMKHLFRPIFPRGNGTVVAPSEVSIRRALSKLVHGAIKEHGMSVELETIKALYKWRTGDKSKAAMGSPAKMSRNMRTPEKSVGQTTAAKDGISGGLSVYQSFVEPEEEKNDTEMMVDGEDDEFDQFEEEVFVEVEAHESRWQRLLYQIWEEEQVLRSPQCVHWLESVPVQILVRGSITTALTSSCRPTKTNTESWKAQLDVASRNIIEAIEANCDKSNILYSIEEQLTYFVSNAQLAIFPQTSVKEDLRSLSQWAWLQGKSADDSTLRQILRDVSENELISWIEGRPSDLGIFNSMPEHRNSSSDKRSGGQQVAKIQLRHASCSCAIRATDFIRRSRLSKCILLLNLTTEKRLISAVFRAYVLSIATLWTSGQRVKMDTAIRTTGTGRNQGRKLRFDDDSPRHSSPPSKRSSFGDNVSSILPAPNDCTSTTLDVVLMKISQEMTGSLEAGISPCATINLLSCSFVDLIFAPTEKSVDGARKFMPELCVLPVPRDRDHATEHPDLALRLLAPLVAFEMSGDSTESVCARKEELSSCLLHAAHSNFFSARRKSRMRETACGLLGPDNDRNINPVQKDYTREGLSVLKAIEANRFVVPTSDMRTSMQKLLPNASTMEVARLCDLATSKHLFSPYASASDASLDESTRSHAVQIGKLMLNLSQVLHRLSILERYVSRADGAGNAEDYVSDCLLQIISEAIEDMEATFPKEFLNLMPEYISIWTRKFNHAVRSCRWKVAYGACVNNPVEAHRENNFNRLVRTMVDSGALDELLDLCTQPGGGGTFSGSGTENKKFESIDLYEIASSVLLTYADCDVYDSRATSSHSANLSDYQGALYALHASQEQWKRAAQSLDLRYVNAEKALRRSTGKVGINVQTSELRDGLIVQDLVLSSCGSANAIQLVRDPDYRFLVSGEYGKFSLLQSGENSKSETPNKLKRGRTNEGGIGGNDVGSSTDRLSRFMVGDHLDFRAIRSIGLRTLFFDRSTSYSFAKSAFRRGVDTSQTDIDELFRNGYYQYGLLLARAWSNLYYKGKVKPEGADLFGGYLCKMMEEYLVPLSSSNNNDISRPTLQQLQLAIDTASSGQSSPSYIVTDKSMRFAHFEKTGLKDASLMLLKELTMTHSTAGNPVALDVARSYLEIDANSQLPLWLENLLLGDSTEGGAFAPRRKHESRGYLGDPTSLMRLYTNRGLFVEACNVVTTILGDRDRAAKAPTRLPEKGSIDCVPYKSIDLLWNLIEISVSKGVFDDEEEQRILNARKNMEESMKKHFALMKISETGMRSARLLL